MSAAAEPDAPKDPEVRAVRELYDAFPYPAPYIRADELEALDRPATRQAIRARVLGRAERNRRVFVEKHALEALVPSRGAGLRLLDAGCGTGINTLQLALLLPEARIEASDLSGAALALLRKTLEICGVGNVRVVQADLTDPGSHAGGYDHVLCLGVVHHTPDPVHTLRNLAGLLAPEGALTVFVYDVWGRNTELLLNRFTVGLARNDVETKRHIIRAFDFDRTALTTEESTLERVEGPRGAKGLLKEILPPALFPAARALANRLRGRPGRKKADWNGNWDAFANPCVKPFDVDSLYEAMAAAGLAVGELWFGERDDHRAFLARVLAEHELADLVDPASFSDREIHALAECLQKPRLLYCRARRDRP